MNVDVVNLHLLREQQQQQQQQHDQGNQPGIQTKLHIHPLQVKDQFSCTTMDHITFSNTPFLL